MRSILAWLRRAWAWVLALFRRAPERQAVTYDSVPVAHAGGDVTHART